MPYRQLDEASILRTLEQLKLRIGERFPGSGLSKVAEALLGVGKEVSETVRYLKSPNYTIRILVGVAIAVMLAVPAVLIGKSIVRTGAVDGGLSGNVTGVAWLQFIETMIQDVIFLGIAIYFLMTLEARLKRRRALRSIHELRSLAHVVDMHQLTKDPEYIASPARDTESSPTRTMTPTELGRYLDYCSELLSVNSKLAALLVQYFTDEVVLGAVNEIETLTTGLSGKMWQKIQLIQRER